MIKDIINAKDFCISSKNLSIIPITKEYAHWYFKEFDEEITKFQYPEPFNTIEEAERFIEDFTELRISGKSLVCIILDNNKMPVGSIEVHGLDGENPEIGLFIAKSYHRKGYAMESINALLDFIRDNMEVENFIYEADIRNNPSVNLVERLGGVKGPFNEVKDNEGKVLKLQTYYLQ